MSRGTYRGVGLKGASSGTISYWGSIWDDPGPGGLIWDGVKGGGVIYLLVSSWVSRKLACFAASGLMGGSLPNRHRVLFVSPYVVVAVVAVLVVQS